MRRLFFFLLLSLSLALPNPAKAANNWRITNFTSSIEIFSNGKVDFQETISVNFEEAKHGIFREIPTDYRRDDGTTRYIAIEVTKVFQDGQPAKYEVYDEDGYRVIKIGDPDQTITDSHMYTINYTATGVLNPFEDHDELYWNSVGSKWEVPVEKASATLSSPAGSLEKIACYTGPEGSTSPCESVKEADSAIFDTSTVLSPGSDLTIVASLKKGAVPILEAERPYSFRDDPRLTYIGWAIAGFILLIGFTSLFLRWKKTGRDLWFRRRFLHDPNQKEEVEPLFNKDTIVVEFEAPEKLRPAEIGTLMDQRADTLDVTATIVDLATRGYLKITEIDKKWLFGSKDYQLERVKEADNELLGYEKELLERLFDDKNPVKLSELKNKFYTDLKKVKEKLYQDTTAKRLFVSNPETVRNKNMIFGSILLSVGFVGFAFGMGISPIIALPALSLGVVGLLWLIFGYFMPRRTAHGHELYRRAKGFEMFIERAEKYRQRFFEKENLFNELLPYAIVFGATEKFAKAFADMGLKPPEPSWYSGSRAFNAVYFGSSLNSFSNSLSSAIASTPGGSGSSGFGGGGFSGGGVGGGGGGSW